MQSAKDVVVVVALAPGLAFVSPSDANRCTSADGGTVTCVFGTLSGGGGVGFNGIKVKVASGVAGGTVLTSTATVTTSSSDDNPDNDSAEAKLQEAVHHVQAQ